jgi:transposase-like protein
MEGLDRFTDEITAFFRGIPAKDREQAISAIRDILDRELFDCCSEDLDPACPACGCEDYVRNGHTAAGTQRYRCSRCGKTFAFRDVGRILLNTKLPHETWMRYAECFVDGLTCPKVAIRLGVTPKTAWFMRIRTLEALSKNLPSFEVKSGCGCQVDELYFAESFKGVSLNPTKV